MKPILAAFVAFVSLTTGWQPSSSKTLDMYFIDVEGGQSTLIVTPSGQTMLVDAGFPGSGTFGSQPGDPALARDPQRILAVAQRAGVSRIDYLLVTHFHADHVGGVPELAQLLPIGTFIDHGGVTADADRVAGTTAIHAAYAAVRAGHPHIEPTPGERLPLTGVEATIVSSAGTVIPSPMSGAGPGPTSSCVPPGIPAQEPSENPRSTGVLLQWGRFRFLDVGDLTGPPLFDLACPSDRLGPIDVYLVSHHGGADAADPALYAATQPRVAVLNNSPVKGGAPATLKTLLGLPHTATWQLHRSAAGDAVNAPDDRIANVEADTAHWIRIRARFDGSFTVTNTRTGGAVSYPAR